jgi:serine/threonine protein phosphatase PrpC
VLPRHPEDEFVVLACDGVWDVLSAEAVCAFVKDKVLVCFLARENCGLGHFLNRVAGLLLPCC